MLIYEPIFFFMQVVERFTVAICEMFVLLHKSIFSDLDYTYMLLPFKLILKIYNKYRFIKCTAFMSRTIFWRFFSVVRFCLLNFCKMFWHSFKINNITCQYVNDIANHSFRIMSSSNPGTVERNANVHNIVFIKIDVIFQRPLLTLCIFSVNERITDLRKLRILLNVACMFV